MSNLPLSFIQPQALKFKNQQPLSDAYNDVYFNDAGGLQEKQYVFIAQNHLVERWQHTQKSHFCVAETGFGTGLNFLATYQAWVACKQKPKTLHYISFEQHPIDLNSLEQAHQLFPTLAVPSQRLRSKWQHFRHGMNHYQWPNGVKLTLIFGDANEYLEQLIATVDAWYLDGFAPQKNPDMWQPSLFQQVARLSEPGTTLTTYTAASAVTKNLQAHGFEVNKVKGFGRKREMISATYQPTNDAGPAASHHTSVVPHWATLCPYPTTQTSIKKVTILGGGIAGMCMAKSMQQAGYETTVIDQHPLPMQQASGNEMAMVMPLITAQTSPESLFHQRAFETACQFYHANEFQPIGVHQSIEAKDHALWHDFIQQHHWPEPLLTLQADQLIYPAAGYVKPELIRQRLISCVDHWQSAEIQTIKASGDGTWGLFDANNHAIHQCQLLVVANGIRAQQLLQPHDLFLQGKHGQTTTVDARQIPLRQILLDRGYLIPDQDQQQWLCGATFDHLEAEQWHAPATTYSECNQRNLACWQHHPLYPQLKTAEVINSFAAIRATTPDHLPICGPVVDQAEFIANHQDLHHGRHWQAYPPAECEAGLYILNGLGSRGFTTAPLLAQYLTAMISSQPLPLEADLCKIIHPNRFLFRALKKANNPYLTHD